MCSRRSNLESHTQRGNRVQKEEVHRILLSIAPQVRNLNRTDKIQADDLHRPPPSIPAKMRNRRYPGTCHQALVRHSQRLRRTGRSAKVVVVFSLLPLLSFSGLISISIPVGTNSSHQKMITAISIPAVRKSFVPLSCKYQYLPEGHM